MFLCVLRKVVKQKCLQITKIYSPTYAFPHPLVPIFHGAGAGYWVCYSFLILFFYFYFYFLLLFVNNICFCIQLSYVVVDLVIWWGLRGWINELRKKKLNLSSVTGFFNTNQISISHLPTAYMWSPHLLPKPNGECSFCSSLCLS